MPLLPPAKPRLSGDRTYDLIRDAAKFDITRKNPVCILGVRGYYRDTMGKEGEQERGIYDDAIIVRTPNGIVSFNANTDPSVFRHGIASLKTGVWWYKIGTHGITTKPKHLQYTALVQAAKVTVSRDGGKEQTDWLGINIHRGSSTGTSSLGCQTIPPAQWPAFIGLVASELKRHGQTRVPYILIEGPVA